MEHIKQNFSIKDLEHLSGIKAHTIRIWEKRYNILQPDRTESNIRTYNGENLQKLLNISFLNSHGYKISRISKMREEEIQKLVSRISASSSEENRAVNSLKMAMMNFDNPLFEKVYTELKSNKDFKEIFYNIFLPLLNEVGMLWQTDTIKPIHEHFIVELIKQKIYLNIAEMSPKTAENDSNLYVLFLPENEIHDIGLLFLHYELLRIGKRVIYVGQSLPLVNMNYILSIHPSPIFLTYLTISPPNTSIKNFIQDFQDTLCQQESRQLLLFGQRIKELDKTELPSNVNAFNSIKDFITLI